MTNSALDRPIFRLQSVIFILILIVILIIGAGYAVMASDLSGAEYKGTIVVTNNSTAASEVSVNFTLSTNDLIYDDYINTSWQDFTIIDDSGNDIPFMPALSGTTTACLFVDSIPASTSRNYYLYTEFGGTSFTGDFSMMPNDNGMESNDSASLELGDNFTVYQDVYINASSGTGILAYKPEAFKTWIAGSGNITSGIYSNETPTGHSDPNSSWTSETNAYDDNTGTYSTHANIPEDSWGNYIYLTRTGIPTESIRYYLSRSSSEINLMDLDSYVNGEWEDTYQGSFLVSQWVTSDLITSGVVTEIRIRFFNDDAGAQHSAYIHEVDFNGYNPSVSALVTPNGNYEVTTEAITGDNLSIYIDSILQDSIALNGASVPDTSDNWTFITGGIPYLGHQLIYVDGTKVQDLILVNTNPLVDYSGYDNTAWIYRRTDSSNANVSALMTTFEPVNPARSSVSLSGNLTDFVTDLPTQANMYTDASANFTGANFIDAMADDSGTPRALIWFPLTFGIIILTSTLIYAPTQSILIKCIVLGLLLFVVGLFNIIGLWVFLIFIPEAFAIIMSQKQYGW